MVETVVADLVDRVDGAVDKFPFALYACANVPSNSYALAGEWAEIGTGLTLIFWLQARNGWFPRTRQMSDSSFSRDIVLPDVPCLRD